MINETIFLHQGVSIFVFIVFKCVHDNGMQYVEISLSVENGLNEVHIRIHVPVEKGFPRQHTL